LSEDITAVLDEGTDDPLSDHDLQLALNLCLNLHFLSFREADTRWEWDPRLIELRTWMEARLLDGIEDEVEPTAGNTDAISIPETLNSLEAGPATRRLASFVDGDCDLRHMAELIIHRSAERLGRTDSYLWVLPRLTGQTREALSDILREDFLLGSRFERTMRAFGLDHRTGAYLDVCPAVTLATTNLPTMLALRRSGRGAVVGHLAAQVALGPDADRSCAKAMDRLGVDAEKDGYHEQSAVAAEEMMGAAVSDLAGRLARDEPRLGADILWGARAYAALQERFAEWVLLRWQEGRSSLLPEPARFASDIDG
jgi:hypothetical protein